MTHCITLKLTVIPFCCIMCILQQSGQKCDTQHIMISALMTTGMGGFWYDWGSVTSCGDVCCYILFSCHAVMYVVTYFSPVWVIQLVPGQDPSMYALYLGQREANLYRFVPIYTGKVQRFLNLTVSSRREYFLHIQMVLYFIIKKYIKSKNTIRLLLKTNK